MNEIKRRVDHHLPKWLHSKILTAVDFIWQVKGDDEKTNARVSAVATKLGGEEMCWVMMLLILPKLNKILLKGDRLEDHVTERTLH